MECVLAGILCFAATVAPTRSMIDSKAQQSNSVMNINYSFKDHIITLPVRTRDKRMVKSFVKLGKIAAAHILKGATPGQSGGRKFRNYKKEGDIGTAFEDFYSVEPVKVYETATAEGIKVLRGTAGDRHLALYSKNSQGFPVLEIIDYKYKKTGGRYIDRVVYSRGVWKKGIDATGEEMMERLEGVFGNVAAGLSVLPEYYSAAQEQNESFPCRHMT